MGSRQTKLADILDATADAMRADLSKLRAGIVHTGLRGGGAEEIVRDMLPNAHFAAVYAKPAGRPLIDTFVTEVSQDTWIYFPWDMGLTYQAPIREGSAG